MRIVFMGTPDFSVPCLQALIDDGHDVCAVFTQPDKPKGRHGVEHGADAPGKTEVHIQTMVNIGVSHGCHEGLDGIDITE